MLLVVVKLSSSILRRFMEFHSKSKNVIDLNSFRFWKNGKSQSSEIKILEFYGMKLKWNYRKFTCWKLSGIVSNPKRLFKNVFPNKMDDWDGGGELTPFIAHV